MKRRAPRNTATRLVTAGRRLFARHGYDGCSVRAITEEAAANLGAVTYHFGSKHGLYDAVVATCLVPFADRVAEIAASAGEPLERIARVVRAYFEHLWENPDLPFLMTQELAAGRLPPPSAGAAMRRMLGAATGLVREGQAEGSIRAGDAVLMALSAIAQPVHLTMVRRMAAAYAGVDQEDAGTRARLVEHVVTFVRRGLMAEQRAARKTSSRARARKEPR